MTQYIWFAVPAVILIAGVLIFLLRRRSPKQLNQQKFVAKWKQLQRFCNKKETWQKAIIDADDLMGEALKKKKYKGGNIGERLTRAQHALTDNEAIWFSHKLRGKIDANPEMKLKETEVKDALIGIRQALKDLGALPDGK